MLHAKYQTNRPSGSGEEAVQILFNICGGISAILNYGLWLVISKSCITIK